MQVIERSIAAPVQETPYNVIMSIWARWMRLPDVRETRGSGNEQDTKEFMSVGSAVDVMVDDLPTVCRWAVLKARGLSTSCWRFPETSMADALERAEEYLLHKMKKSLATKRYIN